jgi:basic membrane lipoprotein Med (substrate-binding protein (PBP1-ABC) superfamily)
MLKNIKKENKNIVDIMKADFLEGIKNIQALEAKAYKSGYDKGYMDGKSFHDGNCIYKDDKAEEFNRQVSEIVEEEKKYKFNPNLEDFNDENAGVIINELSEYGK